MPTGASLIYLLLSGRVKDANGYIGASMFFGTVSLSIVHQEQAVLFMLTSVVKDH